MAAGDVKGDEAVILAVTAGIAIVKGDLVHLESDGYWDPTTTDDIGKFGVAIEAASGAAETVRVVIWGPVEVDCSGNVSKGALGQPGLTGQVATQSFTNDSSGNTIAGTFMESGTDLGTATFWVGLVA